VRLEFQPPITIEPFVPSFMPVGVCVLRGGLSLAI
jgi:hypothetical protein